MRVGGLDDEVNHAFSELLAGGAVGQPVVARAVTLVVRESDTETGGCNCEKEGELARWSADGTD